MDIAFDTTWCPVCSRQILPKRYYVPINPPQQAPAVPPSSPTNESKVKEEAPARLPRNKTGTIRARGGGLVHGTGRVKPNGALKRDDTVKQTKKPSVPEIAVDTRPTGPVRHRTVIDQSPVPLYCSDECRLADLQSSFGAMGMEYNPDRCISPALPPVPHNSFSDFSSSESDSASGASFDSRSSFSSSPPSASSIDEDQPATPEAYVALTKLFPDLPSRPPPAPPLIHRNTNESTASLDDLQSGVMMSAQRIKAALCSEPPKKRSAYSVYPAEERRERKVIPGWTDGTHAWRASVYNLSAPVDMSKPFDDERVRGAYKGFVASSQRSRSGVYSTVSTPTFEPTSPSAASLPPVTRATSGSMQMRSRSEADELSKYPLLHSRCDSRQSLSGALSTSPTGSTRSMPATISTRRKEFSLVKPGAEGRLLVPNVKMTRSPSTTTMSSLTSAGSSYGYYPYGRKPSPLSRQNSDASMETADSLETEADLTMRPPSSSPTKRSTGVSWSYSDDTMTYPILQIPKKEKRIERKIVDGREQDVEVEVEVHQPLKRLFLFPGKDGR
ncbi:uncharacterized protein C8Q71DRAFT_330608 [Rhodofomes roseus]|uniref:Uncharacterized protein n=1 Tax=Rhodofomes roseus TaxID=34475 RepID=A0A4Y9Z4S8_9APHY|nr:uncharacterized protein C8Q71DRAFT_330608 [Rhodofomes roseus]KAH9841460.1 hypothetical protein C8Q71DRAFT_330608 [Rhodofomes roseus]TFY69484.1 hypothetical protein EVJ58_g404 [Rhodofomes roseus]